jgi:hypothetical protein
MSKNTIGRPTTPKVSRGPQEPDRAADRGADAQSTGKSKKSDKASDKKSVKAPPQRPQRPQRMGGAQGGGAAQGAGGAQAAGADAEAGEAQGASGVGSVDGGDNDKRRHVDTAHLEHKEEVKEHVDEGHETAATGADAIKRSKGSGDMGGGDGFEGGKDQREAYERYMKGNVANDKERFDELRSKGTRDDFRPDRPAAEVEALGTPRATAHVVRLYDAWTLAGMGREEAVQKAAAFLADFTSVTNIRKVLAELENKPIRDVYPLEVLMRMLEQRPDLLPGVRQGSVLGPELKDEARKILAGHAHTITVPNDVRVKSFALLGGGRPGYEFQPHKDEGKYTLLVDTPGHHTFALLAAPLQQLGRIQRETAEAILEVFTVTVFAMDKKGEPLTPEEWATRMELEDEGDVEGNVVGEDDDDAAPQESEKPLAEVELAPILPIQIRKALETITRDENANLSAGAAVTTYSWDASFYRPGGPVGFEPILHLVVKNAGPFDQAWIRAREALAAKQKEFEPSRAPVTQEDFTAALRKARVR